MLMYSPVAETSVRSSSVQPTVCLCRLAQGTRRSCAARASHTRPPAEDTHPSEQATNEKTDIGHSLGLWLPCPACPLQKRHPLRVQPDKPAAFRAGLSHDAAHSHAIARESTRAGSIAAFDAGRYLASGASGGSWQARPPGPDTPAGLDKIRGTRSALQNFKPWHQQPCGYPGASARFGRSLQGLNQPSLATIAGRGRLPCPGGSSSSCRSRRQARVQ